MIKRCMTLRMDFFFVPKEKTPTQMKTQFAQTISGLFVQVVPPFPVE